MADPHGLRVAFETLGCRSNYADTIELEAALVERGAIPTAFDSEADVYVINMCTVTDDADKTALRLVRRARALSPNARIVVTGCLAETSPELIRETGAADAVLGPGSRTKVLDAILSSDRQEEAPSRELTKNARSKVEWRSDSMAAPMSPAVSGPGTRLGEVRTRARFHLRVQEGCENSCTFCIIPVSRGRLVSRPITAVLDDITHLEDQGYREIVLTGTHLGGYGEDAGTDLKALLEAISERGGAARFRLSSLDPNDVTPEIVDIIAKNHVFCPHLHICVQAFSDSTLKRMARRYRLSEVYEIVSYIRRQLPNGCLGSDVIAGFPGESRQEVEQATEVFLGLPFSYLHVFPYSERRGTAATRLDGAVSIAERRRRTARWRSLSERRRRDFYGSLLGRELEVILESADGTRVHGTSAEFASTLVEESSLGSWKPGEKRRLRAQSYDEVEGRIVCA
jgi:threonylcarbamoyladenosine tRNA methylthiotransferase MtaB